MKTITKRHRLQKVWHKMFHRCYLPIDPSYGWYGAKGIKVCEGWVDFELFYLWAKDRWQRGLQIDREDNDKGYSPENCHFVTPGVNVCNRGKQVNNRSGYIGVTFRADNGGCWEAKLRYRRKLHYLGRFGTPEDAATARNRYIEAEGLPFPLQVVRIKRGGLGYPTG